MARQSKAEKQADDRIDRAYRRTCSNVEIDMMDIPKIFAQGRALIAQGANDDALGEGIRDFVLSLNAKRAAGK